MAKTLMRDMIDPLRKKKYRDYEDLLRKPTYENVEMCKCENHCLDLNNTIERMSEMNIDYM
jgi:hypothetical protein